MKLSLAFYAMPLAAAFAPAPVEFRRVTTLDAISRRDAIKTGMGFLLAGMALRPRAAAATSSTFMEDQVNPVFSGFDDEFFTTPIAPHFKTDTMRHSSPRYEVTENETQFRLAVDVPGVKSDNVKIELENDGRVLHLSGGRKKETNISYEEFKFDNRFTLGKDLDTSKITAHLSDGVLVLTAPKMKKLPPVKREIAITPGEAPALIGITENDRKIFKKYEKELTALPPGRMSNERINQRQST